MPYGNCGDYYGRGDYYRGDYYRGDPGLFGFLGKAVKGIAGVVSKVVPGPLGAVAGAVSRIGSAAKAPPMALQGPATPFVDISGRLPFTNLGVGFELGPGAGQAGVPGVSLTPSGQLVPCQLKGYHPNKSSYYRRVGGPGSLSGILVPKNSVCVRRRSMNPTNGRALKRALRRAYAFKKIAMRTVRLLNPTKPKRFGGFKKRSK